VTAILRRLVAHDGVLTRLDFKLQRSEMFHGNFHKGLPTFQTI
jgi:hypothetical protein